MLGSSIKLNNKDRYPHGPNLLTVGETLVSNVFVWSAEFPPQASICRLQKIKKQQQKASLNVQDMT